MEKYILAIESSCDDTSAAVIKGRVIQSNVVANQDVHRAYGGVVPELASRAHQSNIIPVVGQALKIANIKPEELSGVAFTQGPGLLGALMVGASFAKGMALALKRPLIGIHHMKAHILAHFIEEPRPSFPFLCLTVSGGHTQLVILKSPNDMEIVGQTQDDAVGEAFDKTAKLLGLPYPGGPLIDQYAKEGNPYAFSFPSVHTPELNFSFSGIKTAFLYFLQKKQKEDDHFIENNLSDICASVQYTLVEILLQKLKKAAAQYNISEVGIAGGVSANSWLRRSLTEAGQVNGWRTYIPSFEYCTDNAAMIAMAAAFAFEEGRFVDQTTSPSARLPFSV
jgi:N6-L-threonylcarbamoyladenine synthase